jgi:hypothetical protein
MSPGIARPRALDLGQGVLRHAVVRRKGSPRGHGARRGPA